MNGPSGRNFAVLLVCKTETTRADRSSNITVTVFSTGDIAKIYSRKTNEKAFEIGYRDKIPIMQCTDDNILKETPSAFYIIVYKYSTHYIEGITNRIYIIILFFFQLMFQ